MTTTTPHDETDALGEERADERPRLAEGVELLGEYEDSGYREPPLMVRRPDNQLVQLAPLLYMVAQRLDGSRDAATIGDEVGDQVGRRLAPDDVEYLIEEKLTPLGIVEAPDGREEQVQTADPLLGLRLRKGVVSERVVGVLARIFSPLFWPPILLVGIAGFVAFDIWLFFSHGLAAGARETLYRPGLLLMTIGMVILAAFFHEVGHAAGCRYGGARPGVMGVGLYIVWPAFYTDVTDAYRLGRGGRLRTDLGGVYFNALFVLILGGVYAVTGLESLLVVALLVQFEMVHQMLPFLRLDGYYVVADLVGVPDLFQRIRPILESFIPWRKSDPRVAELKPWVRFVVTGWVLVVLPIILFQLLLVVTVAPRLIGTAWDAMRKIWTSMGAAFSDGRWLEGIGGVVQLLLLVLPLAGIAYLFWMLGLRFVRGWRATTGRPVARGLLSLLGLAFLVFVTLAWWPEGDRFEPIRSDEQWTLPSVATAAAGVALGGTPGTIDLADPTTDPTADPAADPTAETPQGSGSPAVDAGASPVPSPSTVTSLSPSASPIPSASPSTSLSPSPVASVEATLSASPSVVIP
jgi:putative peptide zinc metalloprotease protein